MRIKRRSLILFIVLGLPLVILLALAASIIERKPLVVETTVPTVETAQRAKKLAKEVLDCLNGQRDTATIYASEEDMNALMTLASRGVPRFSGKVAVTPGIVFVTTSIRVPTTLMGGYLNLRLELIPDDRGINILYARIGKLGFHRQIALAILRRVLDMGLGAGEGAALIRSVQSLSIKGDTVVLQLRSVTQIKGRLKRLQVFVSKLRDMASGDQGQWDRSTVTLYYKRLIDAVPRTPSATMPPLAAYIGPLFRLARERSERGDPVRENSAAMLALAIYLGDPRFDKLVGQVLPPELPGQSSYARGVTLGGRPDLCLHFVISAGLKLLTDQGISTAIGEFKELLDAGRGGSGFSFVDLAADRAGIRFAETALDPGGGARRLQELLAGYPREGLFFPSTADLPENMPRDEFERRYSGVDSTAYRLMVSEIDRRLDKCPVYGRGLRGGN